MRRIFPFACAILLLLAPACGQYLQQFTDEDRDLALTLIADTTASPSYAPAARVVSFSLTFSIDRNGSYRILHAADCSGSRAAGGSGTSGSLTKNTNITGNIQLLYDDILIYGKDVVVCARDTAGYKTAALVKNFAIGLTSTLTNITAQLNENYGGGGVNIDTASSAEFPVFQGDFTSGGTNRGGSIAANSVSNPYSHGAYIDVNDSYRLKYIVADRTNNRVLIFNQLPASSAAAADVVVGQTSPLTGSMNAGGGTTPNNQGFREPVHASVSAAGTLYVTDYENHRVLGFNTIPQTNGATANFVLGQGSMSDRNANFFGAGDDRNLNHPYATHAIGSRLYVVDQGNHRIVVFNTLPTATASANFVIGQLDFNGINSGNADFTVGGNTDFMSSPYDILIYSNRLYVADTGHHRILVFNTIPSSSNARPTFVIGHVGTSQILANQGGSISAMGLNFPASMAAQNDKLAVADQVNNRILFYNLPITGHGVSAQQILGQTGMGTGTSGTTQTTFSLVKGLIFDNGYIWASDGGNNRVKVLQLPY
jgi:NHL repeat